MDRIVKNLLVTNAKGFFSPTIEEAMAEIAQLRAEVNKLGRKVKKLAKQRPQFDGTHLGDYLIPFGKYKNWPVRDVPETWLNWFAAQDVEAQTSLQTLATHEIVCKWLNRRKGS